MLNNKKAEIKYKKAIVQMIFSLIIGTTLFSCIKEQGSVTRECTPPATVSFSQDILPILNTECNISGCHTTATNAGSLNLEASVAYSQLLKPGSGNVDTIHPTYSIFYNKLITSSGQMPPSGKLDDCKIELVLKWIDQKAKNN